MMKRMLRYVVLAIIVALLMGGAFIMSDESLRPNPTLPQKLADGELNNPAYVNQKLDEVELNLLAARDIWDGDRATVIHRKEKKTEQLIETTNTLLVTLPTAVYSMTYIIEVDYPSWSDDFKTVHFPEVTLVGDGQQELTITNKEIYGRGCNEDKYLVIISVVSNAPLSENSVHACVSSQAKPDCAIYKDADK